MANRIWNVLLPFTGCLLLCNRSGLWMEKVYWWIWHLPDVVRKNRMGRWKSIGWGPDGQKRCVRGGGSPNFPGNCIVRYSRPCHLSFGKRAARYLRDISDIARTTVHFPWVQSDGDCAGIYYGCRVYGVSVTVILISVQSACWGTELVVQGIHCPLCHQGSMEAQE